MNTTRRSFLGLSLAVAGVTLETLLGGCAGTLSRILMPSPEPESDFDRLEIILTPFQEYHPAPQTERIELRDPLLRKWIVDGYRAKDIFVLTSGNLITDNLFEKLGKIEFEGYKIKDRSQFKNDILTVASEIGVSATAIETMPVHDLIMLAGKLVVTRLSYEHGMISEKEKAEMKAFEGKPDLFIAYLLSKAFSGNLDERNALAREIDNAPVDITFSKGRGICRNYADVFAGVYSILRELNVNSSNTHVTRCEGIDLDHTISLPHAWDQAVTISRDKDRTIVLNVSYLDPTWLDTRSQKALPGEEKVEVKDEDIFNALDNSHYGRGNFLAHEGIARLYEELGHNNRQAQIASISNSGCGISPKAIDYYLSKAVYKRLELLNMFLDDSTAILSGSDSRFLDIFDKLIQDHTGSPSIGSLMMFGKDALQRKSVDEFRKIEQVYNRILKVSPAAASGKDLSFYVQNKQQAVSITDIFNKLQEAYR